MPTIRSAAGAVTQFVGTATARGSRSYTSAEFARDGFVVREGFVGADDAAAMLADVERFADRSVTATGVPDTNLRDRARKQKRDLHVRQLTGADRLSPAMGELLASGRIEREFAALTGLDLAVGGLTVQVDWPDTETKRGLHVDSHFPPTYKAFIYLTPVLSPANGPFSVVPGSHRHTARKVRAIVGDYRAGRDRTDVDHEYSMDEARCLLGGPGTAIFADQRLAHAGWPEHTTGTRLMIVAYLYGRDITPPSWLGKRA